MELKPTISAARLIRIIPLLLLVGACATGAIREKLLSLPQIEGATPVGPQACLDCHEDAARQMAVSVHGRLAEFELMGGTGGCESCHGPGSKHVASEKNDQIFKFEELSADESAALCARCHSSGKLLEWTHGEHALADVGCMECHAIHGGQKFALKQQEPELCYSCHQEQMAKASFPSHHPVKEGKMGCSSCHNPHGELQTEELARDLCLECHARYQGPFVFEHAPVEEDCTICHDPHGSVADNLLLQNEPFLCLQCHESHFHTIRIGGTTASSALAIDGNQLQGTIPPANTTVAATGAGIPFTNSHGTEGWKMAFGTKCTVCHSVVHGSDLPSQTSPTIGNNGQGFPDGARALTR